MKRYFTYRCALLLGFFLLFGGLSACSPKLASPPDTVSGKQLEDNPLNPSQNALQITQSNYQKFNYFQELKNWLYHNFYKKSIQHPLHIPFMVELTAIPVKLPTITTTTQTNPVSAPTTTASSSVPAKPSGTTTSITAPAVSEETLMVRGTSISLGESSDIVIKKLGSPSRVVDTEYDFDYYIYNNDYKNLVFVAIKDSQVVGYYTDSLNFNFNGISSGADISAVNRALGKSFSLAAVLSQNTDTCSIKILMDKIGTQTVVGVYVLANNVKLDGYTDSVQKNIELLIYDLTNSVRVKNGIPVLTWSSTAAISSRKHSDNMAVKHFFSHINPEGQNPGDRMKEEGIMYSAIGENIIGGYGTSILSNHAWFNSIDHRTNMLNKNFSYLGVGFAYQDDSDYKTYITQDFFDR